MKITPLTLALLFSLGAAASAPAQNATAPSGSPASGGMQMPAGSSMSGAMMAPPSGGMAGGPGMSGGPGMDSADSPVPDFNPFDVQTQLLFGDTKAFTAQVDVENKSAKPGEPKNISMQTAFDSGKSNVAMDLTKIMGQTDPQAAMMMGALGMDRMTLIFLPDKKVSLMVYPGLQSFVESPISAAKMPADPKSFKMETTALGNETVDGHACVKNKVVITDAKGGKEEATVWNATDMKNFPIKIEMTDKDGTSVLQFKDIKLASPADGTFDAPKGFTRYTSMDDMMQTVMMKMMGGGGGGGGMMMTPGGAGAMPGASGAVSPAHGP